jgi:glycosyltransferase involved in cell wall biosynthesis
MRRLRSLVVRPPVAVILPFHGDAAGARDAYARLAGLETREGDELVLADNTEDFVGAPLEGGPVRVLRCVVKRSAYAARNEGAEATSAPWLLFVDADCVLPADLIDRYFATPPRGEDGAVAGQVLGVPDQPGVAPAYARARQLLDQAWLHEHHRFRPMAVTANLLVRREAWAAVGGFAEQTRSGADADFSWRLQDAGWRLGLDVGAAVHHEHRETVHALLVQAARDGAGDQWLARRYEGYSPWITPARAMAATAVHTLRGRREKARWSALDVAFALAWDRGALEDNRAPLPPSEPASVVHLLAEFPGDVLPCGGRVEAVRRPLVQRWSAARHLPATLLEDDGPQTRASAMAWLRGGPAALAPAALRLRADAPGVELRAGRGMRETAVRIVALSGRDDVRIV